LEQVVDNGRSKEVSVRTAQLVQLLTEIGPDIPEIARSLGQFKESVRYRYKEKILNKGFSVQAAPDHERLGLKRVVVLVDFFPMYENYAQSVLTAMSELCYVVSFSKTLPEGKYILNISTPEPLVDSVIRFFERMKASGMFKSVQAYEFDWIRNPPMKAEFYDFDQGRWDFDFAGPRSENFEAAAYRPAGPARYDRTDLLIIKELQKDANKSLKEISDVLKLNYKKLAWHYNAHVVRRNLLRGYRINWMGTRYDFKIEKALHRRHRYIPGILLVKDVDELSLAYLRQKINELPFLWAEAGGRNYYAELAFPVDYLTESLQFISEAVSKVKDQVRMFAADQTNSIGFSISPMLFNERTGLWEFNEKELALRFESLIQQIKRETG